MELLEKRPNMQYNSHFPGYYTSRNLSLDASGSSWPLNSEDKMLKAGNYFNVPLLTSSSEQLFNNKELLKQQMLKHEAIFREQIQELHRVYRRQRELMDEMRRNEIDKHYLRFEASQSNTGLFRTSFQVPRFPSTNLADSQMSAVGSENIQIPSHKNIQACPFPAKSDSCSRDFQLSESKCKKFGKKVLDLQLPADEYIDDEDEVLLDDDEKVSKVPEVSSYHVNRSPEVHYGSDNLEPSSSRGVAETPASLSFCFGGPIDHTKLSCFELPGETKSGFESLMNNFIRNTHKRSGLETSSSYPTSDTEKKQEYPTFNVAGKLGSESNSLFRGFNAEKLPSLSESLNKDIGKAFEFPTFLQGSQQCSERTIIDLDSSRRNSDPSNDSHSGAHGTSCGSTSKENAPLTNMINSEPSTILTLINRRESERIPIVVQALPCFNTSGDKRTGLPGDQSLKEHRSSIDLKSSNCINLNFSPASCSSDAVVSQGSQGTHGATYPEDLLGCWLRPKPVHSEKASNELGTPPPMKSLCFAVGNGSEPSNAKASDSSNKSILGTPNKSNLSTSNLPKTCWNSVEDEKKKGKFAFLDLNMACDSVPEMDNELSKKAVDSGCHIDLNLCMSKDESSQKPSPRTEIDLEAPVSPENKESSPPRGESGDTQVETPLLLLGQQDGDLHDELARIAAEAIISISSSELESSYQISACRPFEISSHDSLHWFAGIVSLVETDPEDESGIVLREQNNGNSNELVPDGVDYFEAMTLKLTETKEEEFYCKYNNPKKEETGTFSSPNLQRKGQTRRGRQRKDFQSDILPSLASLSRYEVTQDLQIIGSLMEATHTNSGTGTTKGRNGCKRGRKSSSASGSSTADCSLSSPSKKQNSNSKQGKVERSIICWGNVTRRRRGKRSPVSNPQLVVSQV
ncbi:hypothetical protein UlMin_008342 [Ulmus minor]